MLPDFFNSITRLLVPRRMATLPREYSATTQFSSSAFDSRQIMFHLHYLWSLRNSDPPMTPRISALMMPSSASSYAHEYEVGLRGIITQDFPTLSSSALSDTLLQTIADHQLQPQVDFETSEMMDRSVNVTQLVLFFRVLLALCHWTNVDCSLSLSSDDLRQDLPEGGPHDIEGQIRFITSLENNASVLLSIKKWLAHWRQQHLAVNSPSLRNEFEHLQYQMEEMVDNLQRRLTNAEAEYSLVSQKKPPIKGTSDTTALIGTQQHREANTKAQQFQTELFQLNTLRMAYVSQNGMRGFGVMLLLFMPGIFVSVRLRISSLSLPR